MTRLPDRAGNHCAVTVAVMSNLRELAGFYVASIFGSGLFAFVLIVSLCIVLFG